MSARAEPRAASDLDIRAAALDDPEALELIAEVQREYVDLYGSPDESAIDPGEFAQSRGMFYIGRLAGDAVAMGGWRRHPGDHPQTGWAGVVAEIKRMYVAPAHRRAGHARALLDVIEASARAAGVDWLLLETGLMQPGAIALYRSCGYRDVPRFGHYAATEGSLHLGKPLSAAAPPCPAIDVNDRPRRS